MGFDNACGAPITASMMIALVNLVNKIALFFKLLRLEKRKGSDSAAILFSVIDRCCLVILSAINSSASDSMPHLL